MRMRKPNNFTFFNSLALQNKTNTLALSYILGHSTGKSNINRLFSTSLKKLTFTNRPSNHPLPDEYINVNVLNETRMVAHNVFEYLVGNLVHEGCYKYKKEKGYGEPGIYIVMFRVLNNEKREIIYKAKFYNHIFVNAILHYFMYNLTIDKHSSKVYNEFGVFETIVDSVFLNSKMQTPISVLVSDIITSLENPEERKDFIEKTKQYTQQVSWKNSHEYFFNQLTFAINLDIMTDLFVLAYEINAIDYMRTLWCSEDFLISNGGWLHDDNISQKINTNMLNNRIFIVENVDLFVEKLRAKIKDKGYTLSGPPKPLRHLHNRLDNYLSYFDFDFRLALFNHLQLHKSYCDDWIFRSLLSNLTYKKDFTHRIDEVNGRFW